MNLDVREALAEALWPKDPAQRPGVRRLVDAPDANRLLQLVQLMSADAATVMRLRRYRREALAGHGLRALRSLRDDLFTTFQANVPRALYGDRGEIADSRLAAKILAGVLRARRRGQSARDPRQVGGREPASGAIVAALREVLDINTNVVARGALTRALHDPDWHVRAGAVRVSAGLLGHRNVKVAWWGLTQDEDHRVRALALRRGRWLAGRPEIDEVCAEALSDPHGAVRREAVRNALASRHLASEVALYAFDPVAEIGTEVRAALGADAIARAVELVIPRLQTPQGVPGGVMRVVYRDAGLPAARLQRIARRRLAALWKSGLQAELVEAVRALHWIPAPGPATRRLAARVLRAPDMDAPALALARSWPADAALAVGRVRLHADDQGQRSLRAGLCEALAERAYPDPRLRAQLPPELPGLAPETAAALVWAMGRSFPADELTPWLDWLETHSQSEAVLRTSGQVREVLAERDPI
jgi:hypothetical protein